MQPGHRVAYFDRRADHHVRQLHRRSGLEVDLNHLGELEREFDLRARSESC